MAGDAGNGAAQVDGVFLCREAAVGMTVIGEFVQHQRNRGVLDSSLLKQRGNLQAFQNWLDVPIETASPEHVTKWLGTKKITDRTRYSWISLLHTFFVWSVDEGHSQLDPTARMPRPKVRPGLPRPITDGDLELALEMAPADLHAWLTLFAYGGLRCCEVAALERADILDAHGLLRLLGKGRKERLVPIHVKVTAAFNRVGLPRAGPIFTNGVGSPWTAAKVSRRVALYFDDLGIDATAHQCRHWFATKCYAASRDIKVVQELLGHSSPTTTSVYAAFSQEFAREAVAQI